MSMMISTSTPGATPPPSADVAQGAPALPGTDATAAFADFMGLDPAAGSADAETPVDEDAAAAELLAQEQQQALSSMQAMMLSMPVTIVAPVQMAAAPALPGGAAGEAPAPAVDAAVAAAAGVAASGAGVAALAELPAAAAPQHATASVAQPGFAAVLSQSAAAPAIPAVADAPDPSDAPAAPVTGAVAAASPPVAAAASDLKLAAATPAAWQQPLREALGDRLQLQLSRNIDQAVIRLDPPNLGRIEIAIRHMGGTLEVNISASHSEVVRQLHTISDTMRTDLAARQFTEVAVNVTTAARGAAGSQQAFDQQGRQRQQDRAAEESGPGHALAEAGNPSSTFSLNARESYV